MVYIKINVNFVKVNNVVQASGLRSFVPTLIQEFVNDVHDSLLRNYSLL